MKWIIYIYRYCVDEHCFQDVAGHLFQPTIPCLLRCFWAGTHCWYNVTNNTQQSYALSLRSSLTSNELHFIRQITTNQLTVQQHDLLPFKCGGKNRQVSFKKVYRALNRLLTKTLNSANAVHMAWNEDNGTKTLKFNNSWSYRHNEFLNVHNTTPSLTRYNIFKSARMGNPLVTNSNGKVKLKKSI